MARKSNKTSHVLNLLSGVDENEELLQEDSAGDPVADMIKDKLLEELAPAEATVPAVPTADLSDEVMVDVPVEEMTDTTPMETSSAVIPTAIPVETPVAAVPVEAPVAETTPVEEVLVTEVPTEVYRPEANYSYINVMECIVKDKVMYFNKEFNMCACDRCIVDTMALALTNLPPKYIVTETSSVSPLLNYYTNKYIGQVTVELTKACMTVKEHPHH